MAADIRVAEDDDEGFGDFAFAPGPVAAATAFVSSNGGVSASQNDDDWSDFVGLGPISSSKSIPDPTSNSSSPAIPDSRADRSVGPPACAPAPSSANSLEAQWLKPEGAIPLSIFGEEEEEEKEEPAAVDPSVADAGHALKLGNGHLAKRSSDLNVGVGLNDLISNLYDRSPKVVNQNGTATDHNANSVIYGDDLNAEAQSGSNLKLSSKAMDSPVLNGNGELVDDEEWEFKFVDAERVSNDQDVKVKA